jgi:DNA-directed RNA polymerase subunit K
MKHTRFEKARIIGARALQITMGAVPLIKGASDLTDVIDLAEKEYDKNILPINVMPNV